MSTRQDRSKPAPGFVEYPTNRVFFRVDKGFFYAEEGARSGFPSREKAIAETWDVHDREQAGEAIKCFDDRGNVRAWIMRDTGSVLGDAKDKVRP